MGAAPAAHGSARARDQTCAPRKLLAPVAGTWRRGGPSTQEKDTGLAKRQDVPGQGPGQGRCAPQEAAWVPAWCPGDASRQLTLGFALDKGVPEWCCRLLGARRAR